jgi:hypothetical protein
MRFFRKKFRPVKNLITFNGQSMTEIDYKLRIAIRIAHEECLGIRSIIPKKENGLIVGYYVINEGGETAVATIE